MLSASTCFSLNRPCAKAKTVTRPVQNDASCRVAAKIVKMFSGSMAAPPVALILSSRTAIPGDAAIRLPPDVAHGLTGRTFRNSASLREYRRARSLQPGTGRQDVGRRRRGRDALVAKRGGRNSDGKSGDEKKPGETFHNALIQFEVLLLPEMPTPADHRPSDPIDLHLNSKSIGPRCSFAQHAPIGRATRFSIRANNR